MSAFRSCSKCGAKVMVSSGHTECSRHRPRIRNPNEKSYDTPEKARERSARRRRARAASGALWI